MNNIQPSPFTLPLDRIYNVIKTECGICEAYMPVIVSKSPHPKMAKYVGLWDTGATSSVITRKVIEELNLKPTGRAKVSNTSGCRIESTYKINILLPNQVCVSFLDVSEGILVEEDVLIGMDVICQGDFAISNSNGKTKFTFQIPATHDIDFVQEHTDMYNTPDKVENHPGQDGLCPCESGKKYKDCHGKGL